MASTAEKDKSKNITQAKHIPKDAQVIMSILKELGINDYEPRVINQILEFTYRYTTCVLEDAKAFANHAKKKTIDLEDVKLATEVVLDKSFTSPPPRHVLSKLAEIKNSMPLPPIRPHCGLRLPPDRYCLSSCNYKLRASNQPKKLLKSAIESKSTIKTQLKPPIVSTSAAVKRPPINPVKSSIVSIPKPVFKFTTNPNVKPATQPTRPGESSKSQTSGADVECKMEFDEDTNTSNGNGVKRKRDDDVFNL